MLRYYDGQVPALALVCPPESVQDIQGRVYIVEIARKGLNGIIESEAHGDYINNS